MKTRITPISLFACAMAFLALPAPAYAMEGENMMMDDMMNMSMGGSMTVPMVEMPEGMSMRGIPESMVMMMDTPKGKRAFVPWYLTPEYAEMLQSMDDGGMAEGVMMRSPSSGRFVFVPWYLSPQFAAMISSEEQMGRGMKMMEDNEGMSYLYVPWYKRR